MTTITENITEVKFENGIALYIGGKQVAKIAKDNSNTVEVYIDKKWCADSIEKMLKIVTFLLEYKKAWKNTALYIAMQEQGLSDITLRLNTLSL